MSATLLFLISLTLVSIHAYTDTTELRSDGFVGSHGRNVVCYVSSWAAYRPDRGNFSLSALDAKICTHFVYAFAGLNENTSEISSLDPYRDLEEDYGLGWYKKLTAFKKRFPHLKVTLAIGGWNEGSPKYSNMASNPASRAKFIQSVLKVLEKHDFDGLDLDWEFPANRDGKPVDKENFATLVKELRMAMPNKILTAAFGAGRQIIESAYDIPSLSQNLDLLHVMAYDYHGTWDKQTGANAPLRTKDPQDYLSIMSTIKYLKQLGAPARKIVLGIPMYGRNFLLKKPIMGEVQQVQPSGDEAQERGFQGPYTREDGFMGYNEICKEVMAPGSMWTTMWDDISKTPYAVNGDKWISYDDEHSVAEKAKFTIEEDLGGVMVWSIDTDDFRGDCKAAGEANGKYPLVTALNLAMAQALEKQNEISTPATKPHDSNNVDSGSVHSIAFSATTVTLLVALLQLW